MCLAPTVVPSCLTRLGPPETTSQFLQVQSHHQHAVHAPTWNERRRHIEVFEKSADAALEKRAERMALCCVSPLLRIEHGRTPILSPGRCRDRLCPLCARVRGFNARRRIKALLQKADAVRMITLDRQRVDHNLADRLQEITDAFKRLRRTEVWKAHVRGGLFVIEVTRGANGDHWHVHMHVLVDGSYFDWKALKAAWQASLNAVGDAVIEAVHHRERAANYVTKYITKGADTSGWSDNEVIEYARGVHRRRLYGTFGKWHKADVARDDDADGHEHAPRHAISWQNLLDGLTSGTLCPIDTPRLLRRLGPLAERLLGAWCPPREALEIPVNAQDFEHITLWGLALLDESPPPPAPPPPPTADAREHTLLLYPQHHL